MKELPEIGKNKIFKTVGIAVILYLILFSNKSDPDSLRNKITVTNIKEGIHTVSEKTSFIRENLKKAEELSLKQQRGKNVDHVENSNSTIPANTPAEITDTAVAAAPSAAPTTNEPSNGIAVNDPNYKISCGDEVEISYSFVMNDQQIGPEQAQKLLIGSNANFIIERGIVGLKKDGTKMVGIPEKITTDKKGKIIPTKLSPMSYRVKIVAIKKAVKPDLTCI